MKKWKPAVKNKMRLNAGDWRQVVLDFIKRNQYEQKSLEFLDSQIPPTFSSLWSFLAEKSLVHPILAQVLHVLGLIHHEHTGEVVLQVVPGQVGGQKLGEIYPPPRTMDRRAKRRSLGDLARRRQRLSSYQKKQDHPFSHTPEPDRSIL